MCYWLPEISIVANCNNFGAMCSMYCDEYDTDTLYKNAYITFLEISLLFIFSNKYLSRKNSLPVYCELFISNDELSTILRMSVM